MPAGPEESTLVPTLPRLDPVRSVSASSSVAYVGGRAMDVRWLRAGLTIHDPATGKTSSWTLHDTTDDPTLEWLGACAKAPDEDHLLAALDSVFSQRPDLVALTLDSGLPAGTRLVDSGIVQIAPDQRPQVARELLWQVGHLWADTERRPAPLRYTLTQGRRHPQRPPKPSGTVYRRHIPWLNTTLSFRTVDRVRDLEIFHRWMNDPVVAEFWQEEGDLVRHQAYLDTLANDPHAVSLIGCFGGQPFGYFEVYWAKEDRIAPFYDVNDYDRGWHVLIGEPAYRGKPFLTAWMPSISHHLFLDDPRTQRLVIEPRIDNRKMIRSLERCGYASLKSFQFPHKRAMLGQLSRERFFAEALWIPHADEALVEPGRIRAAPTS